MHLKKLPTFFVKGDQRRAVYHTVQARELEAAGWKIESKDRTTEPSNPAPVAAPAPAPVQEPVEALGPVVVEETRTNLDDMTRAELVEFAEANGIEFKSYSSKADILEACKEFVNG
jgi:hypothetical protein